MYRVKLKTKEGRQFLLAPFGWSYAPDNHPRVIDFPNRAAARKAACKAWKAPGDTVTVEAQS